MNNKLLQLNKIMQILSIHLGHDGAFSISKDSEFGIQPSAGRVEVG